MGPPMAYHPFARQLVIAKKMSVIDSARFMTLTAVGLADAIIAVLDAKYYYNFWRPITAIRNGDIDDNPATEREATWQPIAPTPMHPEYPCAHCAQSGTVAGVVKAVLGTTEILQHLSAPHASHDRCPAFDRLLDISFDHTAYRRDGHCRSCNAVAC